MRYHLRMIDYKHEYLLNIIKVDLRNLQPPDFKQVKKVLWFKIGIYFEETSNFSNFTFSLFFFSSSFFILHREQIVSDLFMFC